MFRSVSASPIRAITGSPGRNSRTVTAIARLVTSSTARAITPLQWGSSRPAPVSVAGCEASAMTDGGSLWNPSSLMWSTRSESESMITNRSPSRSRPWQTSRPVSPTPQTM